MGTYRIEIREEIPAQRDRVFALFADHGRFGRMLGVPVKRVRDSDGEDPNGVGSVRRIGIAGPLALEETITRCEPDEAIDYAITSRTLVRDHQGSIRFADSGNGGTHIHYTIQFDDVIPFT
ncbi:MAG: SRPBCC family protein, partial [Pseudomonadota bacterium]